MERRTFLKGALIAASTPAAAFAPSATVTLGDLIAYHGRIWAECRKATAIVDDLVQGGPDYPCLRTRDLGPHYYGALADRKFFFEEEIGKYFDKLDSDAQRHIEYGFTPKADQSRVERLKADRMEALRRFAQMKADRKAWEDAVGLTAAQAESDRLADLELEYDRKIMNWPIQTLDEAKQIASYLKNLHEGKIPKDAALKLIEGLAT